MPPLPADAPLVCPFAAGDLTRIFSHPVFAMSRALPMQRHAARMVAYWLPLLLLCSSARFDEATALRTNHLRYSDDIPAIPYWDFHGLANTRRALYPRPVHPILIRLGLLEYVRSRPRNGVLFPTLVPDAYGRRAGWFVPFFHGLLREELGIAEPCKGIYSFRRNFVLACRAALPPDLAAALCGHAMPSGPIRDVDWPLPVLQQAMVRLTFPGFPL